MNLLLNQTKSETRTNQRVCYYRTVVSPVNKPTSSAVPNLVSLGRLGGADQAGWQTSVSGSATDIAKQLEAEQAGKADNPSNNMILAQ